jgi:hypothetical protein
MVPFAAHLLLLETMFCFGKKFPNLATKKIRGEDFNSRFFLKKPPLNSPYFKNKNGEIAIFRP